MHYHHAYWSIQAPLNCLPSGYSSSTLCAPGWYGPVGQVVRILSWTSMRHTYLVVAAQSALQRLTSLYPWANFSQPALWKSAWPHHWVSLHASTVLWPACQPCHGTPLKNFTTASPQVRIPELMLTTAHMHYASHIMCVVTVWHPSIGNIIPILGYIILDTPVTVVTSGELWNWNQAAKWNQNLAAVWGLSWVSCPNRE